MTLAEEQQALLIAREARYIDAVEQMLDDLGVQSGLRHERSTEAIVAVLLAMDPPIGKVSSS